MRFVGRIFSIMQKYLELRRFVANKLHSVHKRELESTTEGKKIKSLNSFRGSNSRKKTFGSTDMPKRFIILHSIKFSSDKRCSTNFSAILS
ncbi:hypothetical protein Mgra_00005320 [Meloidogyne graminicola]|uniref:Uncharacterized protein n=1 Tax=Meloidogyne graminicola TaxID=189291 RepID=A0A8S9ZPJ6_9BILA|nr:hypothetical protein Mgra_00005320 [Meloidogyne graminicola]